MFDFHSYLRSIIGRNLLARREGYIVGSCSGIEGLEAALQHFSTARAFAMIDDVTTGETFLSDNGGYYVRRTFTLFLLQHYDYDNEAARRAAMNSCRELLRQLQSRLLKDREEFCRERTYINLEHMPSTEISRYFLNGTTGLYVMISMDEPQQLCYNAAEWSE